ncbi:hypothetical protein ACLB1T_26855 [Escherichia coli]
MDRDAGRSGAVEYHWRKFDQALDDRQRERDAAVAFLVTASGLTLVWYWFCVLGINCRRRLCGVEFNR